MCGLVVRSLCSHMHDMRNVFSISWPIGNLRHILAKFDRDYKIEFSGGNLEVIKTNIRCIYPTHVCCKM